MASICSTSSRRASRWHPGLCSGTSRTTPTRAAGRPGPSARMAGKLEPWRRVMNQGLPGKNPPVTTGAGAVILHARDAKVHGAKLRYEAPAHKDTLGFWVQKDDWAEWEFDLPRAGVYE